MKLLASRLASISASMLRKPINAYSHYMALRMEFRAKLLNRTTRPAPALSDSSAHSEPKTAESCC